MFKYPKIYHVMILNHSGKYVEIYDLSLLGLKAVIAIQPS